MQLNKSKSFHFLSIHHQPFDNILYLKEGNSPTKVNTKKSTSMNMKKNIQQKNYLDPRFKTLHTYLRKTDWQCLNYKLGRQEILLKEKHRLKWQLRQWIHISFWNSSAHIADNSKRLWPSFSTGESCSAENHESWDHVFILYPWRHPWWCLHYKGGFTFWESVGCKQQRINH